MRIGVIMAGGVGERFWPLSRAARPKQLLCLTHPERNMLQMAVGYLEGLIPPENMFIITSRQLVDPIRAAEVGIPPENVIGEPAKRNTTGALVYIAAVLRARFAAENLTLAITTADHFIGDIAAFKQSVGAAMVAAEAEDALVVCGISPTAPETGFGYMEVPENAVPIPLGTGNMPAYPLEGFREKPDAATAQQFLESGRYFWNSGMFFWRLSMFERELARVQPETANVLQQIASSLHAGDDATADTLFESLPNISVDYALMEKASRVLMVRGDFPWRDMGSWQSLGCAFPPDESGNIAVGAPVVLDSHNCVIYNEVGQTNMAVGVLGVEGLAVVVTQDAVLVLPKDRAQDVRRIVAELKRRDAPQL
jgi:mannose-1-phosphate guanylyltransferase